MAEQKVDNFRLPEYGVEVEVQGDGSLRQVVATAGASTGASLTGASPTAVSIGTSSSVAVTANSNRKGLILVNTSSNNISLAFGTAAVLNSGITLTPNGSFNMDSFSYTTQEVRAIASAASSNLAIQEFT